MKTWRARIGGFLGWTRLNLGGFIGNPNLNIAFKFLLGKSVSHSRLANDLTILVYGSVRCLDLGSVCGVAPACLFEH